MNAKRQMSALRNRDWSSKTQKDNAKYLRKKLQMLGYKVPGYMTKNSINEHQIELYVNRLLGRLEKINIKEERKRERERKKLHNRGTRESKQQKLKRLVTELNNSLDTIHTYVDNNYSGELAKYLKGGFTTLTTRDKSFVRDSFDARKVDLENFVYTNIDTAINMISNRLKNSTLKNFIKSVTDSSKSDTWFDDLLGDSLMQELGGREKRELLNSFNDLNAVQKEFFIKDYLNDLKDEYKNLEKQSLEDEGVFDYDKIGNILFNRISSSLDTYKNL